VDKTALLVEKGAGASPSGLASNVSSCQSPPAGVVPGHALPQRPGGSSALKARSRRNRSGSCSTPVSTSSHFRAAKRAAGSIHQGQKGVAQTANGSAQVYRIKLDSVKVGEIALLNVDAIVMDGGGLVRPLLA